MEPIASGGAPQELFREPNLIADDRGVPYQPSADGRQFLVLLPVGGASPAPPPTVVANWQATLRK